MADLQVTVTDGASANDKVGGSDSTQPQRYAYLVTAENGIIKNGQLYPKGSQVALDTATAARAAAAGDIQLQQEQTNGQQPING